MGNVAILSSQQAALERARDRKGIYLLEPDNHEAIAHYSKDTIPVLLACADILRGAPRETVEMMPDLYTSLAGNIKFTSRPPWPGFIKDARDIVLAKVMGAVMPEKSELAQAEKMYARFKATPEGQFELAEHLENLALGLAFVSEYGAIPTDMAAIKMLQGGENEQIGEAAKHLLKNGQMPPEVVPRSYLAERSGEDVVVAPSFLRITETQANAGPVMEAAVNTALELAAIYSTFLYEKKQLQMLRDPGGWELQASEIKKRDALEQKHAQHKATLHEAVALEEWLGSIGFAPGLAEGFGVPDSIAMAAGMTETKNAVRRSALPSLGETTQRVVDYKKAFDQMMQLAAEAGPSLVYQSSRSL